jgi:hypothetical protein
MKVSLATAAKIITNLSGIRMSRKSFLNQVIRGGWPYPVYKPNPTMYPFRLYLVNDTDAVEYSKTYKGFEIGRPKLMTPELFSKSLDVLESVINSCTPH